MATAEIVKREYKERKIDSYEHYRSYRAVKNALKTIDVDGRDHYERMIREHKLTNIGYEYVKYLVLYFLHHEEAKNMFDEHERKQTEIQEWLNSDSNTTWEEWLRNHGDENEDG
jgi:predicted hydrocarbon binding protein